MNQPTTAPPVPEGSAGDARMPRPVRAARNGVAVVFVLNGVAGASWFARVPAARDALELSPGRLGLLLLAMSGGAVLAMAVAGTITHRLGPARTVAAATALLTVALGLVGAGIEVWASVPVTAVSLFALGYGMAVCDVAMNVEAALVEHRLARTIMPRFHAGWSLGTVAAAAAATGSTRIGLPVQYHLTLIAIIVLAGTLLSTRAFLNDGEQHGARDGHERKSTGSGSGVLAAWREPRTLLIGLVVLVMAFTEGTANDWVAVAFVDGKAFTEAAGAATFGVFVAAMTIGRLTGTTALDRWGRVPVLLVTTVLAILGVCLAVLAGSPVLALVGIALWGLGASLGFPVGMSAAADDEQRAAARVGVVAMIGYTAFLAGPPVVGLLGDRVGILRALLVVPVLLVPVLALLPVMRRPPVKPPHVGEPTSD